MSCQTITEEIKDKRMLVHRPYACEMATPKASPPIVKWKPETLFAGWNDAITLEEEEGKAGYYTDADSMCTEASEQSIPERRCCRPRPGSVYIIRNLDTDCLLTSVGHELHLIEGCSWGGFHWLCFDMGCGWLGFRAVITGRFLGVNDKGVLKAYSTDIITAQPFLVNKPSNGSQEFRAMVGKRMRTARVEIPALRLQHADDAWRGEPPHEYMDWEFVEV